VPIRSISDLTSSSCIAFSFGRLSFGQGLFNLPANSRGRVAFPFKKAQTIPQTDDFSLSVGVHDVHSGVLPKVNEKRTQRKPLERFQAKWRPVRVKKTRQIKNLEPRFDSIETEKAPGLASR